jgi:hypothetical protein
VSDPFFNYDLLSSRGGIILFIAMTLNLLDKELEKNQLALSRISDEALWKKLREGTNSIGNLCLHLAGNEYHNIVSSIGAILMYGSVPLNFWLRAVTRVGNFPSICQP